MSKNNPIVKLTYKHEFFDINEMRIGAKTITTITDDGSIVIKDYKPGNRKVHSTKKSTCTIEQFQVLCDKLETCIETADKWDMWVDDCSEELKLFYKFTLDDILSHARSDIEDLVRFSESDDRNMDFKMRFAEALKENDYMIDDSKSDAYNFFMLVYGCIQQANELKGCL